MEGEDGVGGQGTERTQTLNLDGSSVVPNILLLMVPLGSPDSGSVRDTKPVPLIANRKTQTFETLYS